MNLVSLSAPTESKKLKYKKIQNFDMVWAKKDIALEERMKLATYPSEKLVEEFKTTKNPTFQRAIFDRIASNEKDVAHFYNIVNFAIEEDLARDCAKRICTTHPLIKESDMEMRLRVVDDKPVLMPSVESIATSTKFNSVAEEILSAIAKSESIAQVEKFDMLGNIGSRTKNPMTVKRAIQLIKQSEAPEAYKNEGIGAIRAIASFEPKSIQRSVMEELKIPFSDYGELEEIKKHADSMATAGRFEEAVKRCDDALKILETYQQDVSKNEKIWIHRKSSGLWELKGDIFLKMGKSEEAAEAYWTAARKLYRTSPSVLGLEIVDRYAETRNFEKMFKMVKESESENALEEFNKIAEEPNPLARISMVKEYISNFIEGMVKKGEIKEGQKAKIYEILSDVSVRLENHYYSLAKSRPGSEEHAKEEKMKVDARGGELKFGVIVQISIPTAYTHQITDLLHSAEGGKISVLASYKIALEYTRAFICTLLKTGERIVENKPFALNLYYNPIRKSMGPTELWSFEQKDAD
jgi:tetratricopeptide (TPR) repeat protein